MAWCPLTARLLLGTSTGAILVLSTETWQVVEQANPCSARIYDVQVSGSLVWAATEAGIFILRENLQVMKHLNPANCQFRSLAFPPTFEIAAFREFLAESKASSSLSKPARHAVWAASPANSTIILIDPQGYTIAGQLRLHQEYSPTALLHLNTAVIVGTTTGLLLFCDANTGEICFTVSAAATMINKIVLNWLPDSQPELWTVSNDPEIRVWTTRFELLQSTPWVGSYSKVRALLTVGQHVWTANFTGEMLAFDGATHLPIQDLKPLTDELLDEITALVFVPPQTMVTAFRNKKFLALYNYRVPQSLPPGLARAPTPPLSPTPSSPAEPGTTPKKKPRWNPFRRS
jgi:hypothetical protein